MLVGHEGEWGTRVSGVHEGEWGAGGGRGLVGCWWGTRVSGVLVGDEGEWGAGGARG